MSTHFYWGENMPRKARSSGFKNNTTHYMRYSDTFYDRVTEGNNSYLHARPIHYQLVGVDKIGDINSQLEGAINRIIDRTENGGILNELIAKQQEQEIKKMNQFVAIYNSNKTSAIEKIERVHDAETLYRAVLKINGKIKSSSASGKDIDKQVTRVKETVNEIVSRCVSEDKRKDPTQVPVNKLKPDDFIGLYEVVEEIGREMFELFGKEEDPISTELYNVTSRKIVGFLKYNKEQYNEYKNQTTNEYRTALVDDPALWDVLEAIGEKPWGSRNKEKSYAKVIASIQGSARGKANQMTGLIDEMDLAGLTTEKVGDVANYISGFVEGKVKGFNVGTKLDKFKKQQKIDVKWGFENKEGKFITMNISSKVNTGRGGVEIHGGGGLDSYITRFQSDPYTQPISEIFSNNNFRYFYVNEFYGRSRGYNMNNDFRNAMYNAIKATMPTMMGVQMTKSGVLNFNGVDFLSINRKLIPVSVILRKISNNLKDVNKITRGMSLNFDAKNASGAFLKSRYTLLRSLPRINKVNYYTDAALLSAGNADATKYMNHIKITMKLTKSLVDEVLKQF